jgi:hypothetical protein
MDEAELLDVLTSALTITTKALQGVTLDPKKPGFNLKDLNRLDKNALRFCEQLYNFVAALLSSEMRAQVDPDLQNIVGVEALIKQYRSLMFALAKWLGKEPGGKLGDLFSWVNLRQANEEVGAISKSAAGGGKR